MSKWIYMVRFGDFCTVKEAHQEKNWIVVTSKNVAMFKISTNQTKIHQFSFIGVIKMSTATIHWHLGFPSRACMTYPLYI